MRLWRAVRISPYLTEVLPESAPGNAGMEQLRQTLDNAARRLYGREGCDYRIAQYAQTQLGISAESVALGERIVLRFI